jgi:hypothetical protein
VNFHGIGTGKVFRHWLHQLLAPASMEQDQGQRLATIGFAANRDQINEPPSRSAFRLRYCKLPENSGANKPGADVSVNVFGELRFAKSMAVQ